MSMKAPFTTFCGLLLAVAFLVSPAFAGPINEAMVTNIADVEEKLIDLAEAMPADKFSWRPAEGVRSVSETFMHIAGANFFFSGRMGVDPPEGTRELEKAVTTKNEVIAKLKESFVNVKKGLGQADLTQTAKLFGGREGTMADFALIAVGHAHEHLGQLIAYARSNGVTPPWSK